MSPLTKAIIGLLFRVFRLIAIGYGVYNLCPLPEWRAFAILVVYALFPWEPSSKD